MQHPSQPKVLDSQNLSSLCLVIFNNQPLHNNNKKISGHANAKHIFERKILMNKIVDRKKKQKNKTTTKTNSESK